jgi:hypothetical protein
MPECAVMARPPLFDVAATAWVYFRVTPMQQRELAVVAAENHTTVSGVLRDALLSYISARVDVPPIAPRRPTRAVADAAIVEPFDERDDDGRDDADEAISTVNLKPFLVLSPLRRTRR